MTSLRVRLLLPILAAAVATAVAVTAGSYALGDRQVQQTMEQRFQAVARTIAPASFPLTDAVLATLAELSGAQLVALADDGTVARSTLEAQSWSVGHTSAPRRSLRQETEEALRRWSLASPNIEIAGKRFHARMISRRPGGAAIAPLLRVAVLFDQQALQQARLQAAALPLLTGLSTTFALTAVTLLLTGRLVARLGKLQLRVERIASGDFAAATRSHAADGTGNRNQMPATGASAAAKVAADDEVAALSRAVDAMACQLQQLWRTVQQQERDKLLHQMAAGLAHQLRNSLTGARIALDLHAVKCNHGQDEGLKVAIGELERIEAYVRRILLIGAGRQHPDAPGNVAECLSDVQQSLAPVARHLGVRLAWRIAPQAAAESIADTTTLSMAISNLVLNALQAGGREVDVSADLSRRQLTVQVADDGPGPPGNLNDRLFEPFVSSKPEGLGLGLPLVRRAAEKLGGTVTWSRQRADSQSADSDGEAGRTVFTFQTLLVGDGPVAADRRSNQAASDEPNEALHGR